MNFDLPPFYVGQKVICMASFDNYKKAGFNSPIKDRQYTVRKVLKLDGKWCLYLSEVVNEAKFLKISNGQKSFGEVGWVAKYFVELEPLELEKIEFNKNIEVLC